MATLQAWEYACLPHPNLGTIVYYCRRYDIILSCCVTDDHPHPSRELSSTSQGSRPRTRPVPTQPPANHRSSVRVRSHSSGEPETEEFINMRGTRSEEPTTAPPSTHLRSPFKSTLISSSTRPKSSYHPLSQPNSLLLPSPAVSSPPSLPPPLIPVSLSLASHPTQSSGATSLEDRPHPCPRPIPVGDEAVLSQMKVLHKYKNDNSSDALTRTSSSHIQKPLPPIPLIKDNMKECKRKEETINKDSGQPLSESIEKTSGNTVELKGKAKNNPESIISPVDDPFLNLDPFPSIKPQSEDGSLVFTEETLGAHSLPLVSGTYQNHSQAPSDDLAPESSQTTDQDSFSFNAAQDLIKHQNGVTQNPPDNLGDSILEALDFAVTPASNHKKVSPQNSQERKTTRSQSEENLLDSSYNTFETMLFSTKDRQASRASIIEEFDPLVTSHFPEDHTENKEKKENELLEQKGRDVLREKERDIKDCVPPKPTPQTAFDTNNVSIKDIEAAEEEGKRDSFDSPPDYFAEGGAVALEEQAGVDEYTSRYSGVYALSDGGKGRSHSSSEDTSSMYSWPPDYSARTPSDPASPVYPCLHPEEEEEQETVDGTYVGVGHSAFYIPPITQVGYNFILLCFCGHMVVFSFFL